MKARNILGYVVLIAILIFWLSPDLSANFVGAVNSLFAADTEKSTENSTGNTKKKVVTYRLRELIREYEEDVVITVEGDANAKYADDINKAKAMLDGSKTTQKEVDSLCTTIEHSRNLALEETANQFALPAIEGKWYGVRWEKHEVNHEEIYGSPYSISGYDTKTFKRTIGSYDYSGDLDVQGATIINNGPEYHWFGKEKDTVYGTRHEIDACFLLRGTGVADKKLFYSDDEANEFQVSTKYDVYGYRTPIIQSDQIAENAYPISKSMWYLMRSGDGDRLVWMRVFKDTRNHDSSHQKTSYKRQYYTVVKYIWSR